MSSDDAITASPRCAWATDDPLLQTYHDAEWGRPQRDGRALWEKLMLDGFQAGLSWRLILQRRESLRAAFSGFDPALLADWSPDELPRIMAAPGMIRSERKIRAVLHNARAWQAMHADGEDFGHLAWEVVDGSPVAGYPPATTSRIGDELSRRLRHRGFQFAGPRICHAWAQACGLIHAHEPECFLFDPELRPPG
mgnify:FL=1